MQVNFVDFVQSSGKDNKVEKIKMTELPPIGKILFVKLLDFVQPPGKTNKVTKRKITEFPSVAIETQQNNMEGFQDVDVF